MATVDFSFDPATPELQAVFAAIIGDEYQLNLDIPFANSYDDIATSDPQTAVISGSDMGTLGSGRRYAFWLAHIATVNSVLAAAVLQEGSDSEYVLPVTWTYDGSGDIAATFTAPSGHAGESWVIQAIDATGVSLGTDFVTTTGFSQTKHLTFTPPAAGNDVVFLLWTSTGRDWAIARATVGSTTVDKGDYTFSALTAGFTISADPTTVTFATPGAETVEIDVGEVTSAETVNLTVDDSALPAGVTASLDVSSGTTPFTATLTLTAAAGASCDTGTVTVTGDDGTNTHDVTISIVLDGTDGTYDETSSGAQAGSDMSQSGNAVDSGNMAVFDDELYWAWAEQGDGDGPYIAKWNAGTSDWDIVADATVFGETLQVTRPKLATDGESLFFSYLAHRDASWHDCHDPAGSTTVDENPFFAQVWKFDGTTWTYLGQVGCGCVINDGSYGDEFAAGDSSSDTLELTASPAEPGACYVAFFEEGYEGPNALTYPASRHLTVAGFGTSTLGEVNFDGLLFQPDRPTDPDTHECLASTNFAPQAFSIRLVGSGDDLTLYVQELAYDPLTSGFWTKIQVWQPAGFLPDVTLATDFPYSGPGTLIGYGPPLAVSNDVGSVRWVMVERPNTFITENMVVRQTTEAAPGTFGLTFGIADGSADSIFAEMNKLVGEPGNLWAIDTDDTGNILLLTNRCGVASWANFTGGTFASGIPYTGDPVIFDDAFWLSGGTGHGDVKAFRAPICRGCGECCGLVGGLRAWQRF
jgi:hypothetical protein